MLLTNFLFVFRAQVCPTAEICTPTSSNYFRETLKCIKTWATSAVVDEDDNQINLLYPHR